ncbi:RhoGAP-domain-containing protein [Meredithblackwellia eburnea MCA 4105]
MTSDNPSQTSKSYICHSPTPTHPHQRMPYRPFDDDPPTDSNWHQVSVTALLAENEDDPNRALAALISRHNELVRQFANLTVEKETAEKAAERSAQENQQLWRSFRANGGSPRPPAATRSNSSGLGGGFSSGSTNPTTGVPLRRGMSAQDSSSNLSALGLSPSDSPLTATPVLDDPTTSSFRAKATTPPPLGSSPNLQTRRDSHSSLRKATSLDLGRRGSSTIDGSASERPSGSQSPSASPRTFSDRQNQGSPRFPTSASMPTIPVPDLERSPNGSTPNQRRFLPSIIPVSPLQVGHQHQGSDSVASSPRGDRASPIMGQSSSAPDPYQLQLPTAGNSQRQRTLSNTSASSLGSGSGGSTNAVVDERFTHPTASKLSPLAESSPLGITSPQDLFSSPPPSPPSYALGESAHPDDSLSTPRASQMHHQHSSNSHPNHHHHHSSSSRTEGSTSSSTYSKPRTPSYAPPQAPAPRPTLLPAFFPFTRVRVGGSNIKGKEKGKEVISFIIDVIVTVPPESDPDHIGGMAEWRVEKLYSEITALDSAIRVKQNKPELKGIGPLPDKSLFKDHAPHKSDQRKTIIQRYLQSLLGTPFRDRSAIAAFFNSDILNEPLPPPPTSGAFEGWLTKRGRNFGGWQTRYYVLAQGCLSYYETREGQKIGEIPLQNAAIGRQSSKAADAGDDSYIHAFLIRTSSRGPNEKDQDADHILCAESDEARDAWVTALTTLQVGPTTSTAPRTNGSASFDRSRETSEKGSYQPYRRGSDSTASTAAPYDPTADAPQQPVRRGPTSDIPPSMSLPMGLDVVSKGGEPSKRSLSAQGQYQDHRQPSSSTQPQPTPPAQGQRSVPGGGSKSHSDRPSSPETKRGGGEPHKFAASQVSGPMNATPMPSGYDFKKAERSKKTKSSFWNFARGNGPASLDKVPSPASPPIAQHPVFGVPLKEAVAVSRIRPGLELPAVVYRCVEYLEAKNAEAEEGIFRLSGSTNTIRVLKDRFNAEGDIPLLHSNEYYDPHAIAGLLKAFLRELPGHLLTRDLHTEFLQVIELRHRKDRVNALGKLVARLPIEEYTLFRFFFAHLCVIAQNAEVNKMNLRNLGIVFSPTLAIPAPLFSLLLAEFDLVFAVEPVTGLSRPIMVDEDPSTPERAHHPNRNSQLYEATGAQQLMEYDTSRAKIREQVEEESETESDAFEEAPEEQTALHQQEGEPSPLLSLPTTPQNPSSPRTPTFRGLPPSPRPGATFDTRP